MKIFIDGKMRVAYLENCWEIIFVKGIVNCSFWLGECWGNWENSIRGNWGFLNKNIKKRKFKNENFKRETVKLRSREWEGIWKRGGRDERERETRERESKKNDYLKSRDNQEIMINSKKKY